MAPTNPDTDLEVREKQAVDESQGEATWEGPMFRPDVDIYSTPEHIVLLTDLPGVKQENLDIDLREGVLTLVGHAEEAPEGFVPASVEYRTGGYVRRFTLADDVDSDGIEAVLKDGVLKLILPRAKAARPRKIEVQLG